MGMILNTAGTLAALAIGDDEVFGAVVDERDSERGTVVLRGTVMLTFAEVPDQPVSILVHDHVSTDEAQACAQSMLDEWSHRLAESIAMSNDPTVALSQLYASGLYI